MRGRGSTADADTDYRGCVSRRARVAAFPDIFVVHATNFLHLRPVPPPNSSSRLALPDLTPASPVQKPPPSQSSMPPRSQPFPTGRSQKALFATGKAVVVVDWTCGSSGRKLRQQVIIAIMENVGSPLQHAGFGSEKDRWDIVSNLQLTVKIGDKCLK
ncbi:hypothetical protein BU17DRAFT_71660 [Hysterangium stoloniferum]|nr:hypothetical protein BU17DRAFT_71660 [Hysterangium stoloniferum]